MKGALAETPQRDSLMEMYVQTFSTTASPLTNARRAVLLTLWNINRVVRVREFMKCCRNAVGFGRSRE
jgi:hypothetical protein